MRAVPLLLSGLILSGLILAPACGFTVADVRCRADADCGADRLCIGGLCEAEIDRPPPPDDGGPPPPDDGGPPPPPEDAGVPLEVDLVATPAAVAFGQSVTLSWTSNRGDCTLDGEPVLNADTRVLDQPVPFRHRLVCDDGSGPVEDSVEVTVDCGETLTEVTFPFEDITSEAQITAALNGVTGCFRAVGASVVIRRSDLVDLRALYGLVEVDFDLFIDENTQLSSLEGLGLLRQVNGRLQVGAGDGNDLLTDLRGLDALELTGVGLTIDDNARLRTLTGLEKLTDAGDLALISNRDLENVDALANVTTLDRLQVRNCESLEDLSGLANIVTLPDSYDVLLRDLPRVRSLAPLRWATTVGFFEIESLDRLEDLSGLEDLATVFQLEIISNELLVDISALTDVTGDMGCLRIEGNESLTRVDGFDGINMIPDQGCRELVINNNAPGTTVTGFSGVTTVGRLELNDDVAAVTAFANLATAVEIFLDDNQLDGANLFPALTAVDRMRFDDLDTTGRVTLPSAAIGSLFLQNNDLLEAVDVNGATATCWFHNNNPLLLQAEIDRLTGLLGVPQASCP